jgi:hypothetical protein
MRNDFMSSPAFSLTQKNPESSVEIRGSSLSQAVGGHETRPASTALPREAIEDIHELAQLLRRLRLPLGETVGDTVLHVKFEHAQADSVEGGFRR